MKFKNKNFVISGSTKGIGYKIAENILINGGNILITGRNKSNMELCLKKLKQISQNGVCSYLGDLNQKGSYKKINHKLKKLSWIEINGIIANAGELDKSKKNINEKNLKWYLDKNFFNSFHFVNNFLDNFICNNCSIIFISTIATNLNISAPFGYSASKILINHYSKFLSQSLSKKKIRVNTISPGNILHKNNNWEKKLKNNRNIINRYIQENVPLNRFGNPDDIANLTSFLLSSDSSFINGANIICDGGQIKY